MKKSIVLCADDYGQAPAISQGILALVKSSRLSAVSCMVTTEHWQEHAQWLIPFQSRIDIGLHFNLTEGGTPLPTLMMKAVLRQLSSVAIMAELNAQIDAFADAMGFLPHFIDGHQHVHQFPIIRQALVDTYEQRLKDQKPYIRVTNAKLKPADFVGNFKNVVMQAMGTQALKHLLSQRQIPHNQSFGGMYLFSSGKDYAKLFPIFLREIGERGLIMCHPALNSSSPNDPIAQARYLEYQYFAGSQYPTDCQIAEVAVGRFG